MLLVSASAWRSLTGSLSSGTWAVSKWCASGLLAIQLSAVMMSPLLLIAIRRPVSRLLFRRRMVLLLRRRLVRVRRQISLRRLSRRTLLLSHFGSTGAVLRVLLLFGLSRLLFRRRMVPLLRRRFLQVQRRVSLRRLSRRPLLLSSFGFAGAVLRVLLLSDLCRLVRLFLRLSLPRWARVLSRRIVLFQ